MEVAFSCCLLLSNFLRLDYEPQLKRGDGKDKGSTLLKQASIASAVASLWNNFQSLQNRLRLPLGRATPPPSTPFCRKSKAGEIEDVSGSSSPLIGFPWTGGLEVSSAIT